MTGINGSPRPLQARELGRSAAAEPQQPSRLRDYVSDPKLKKHIDLAEKALDSRLRQAENEDHKISINQGTAGLYKPNTCYEFRVPIPKDPYEQEPNPVSKVFNYIKESISPSPKSVTIERCTNRFGDQPDLHVRNKPTSILGSRG